MSSAEKDEADAGWQLLINAFSDGSTPRNRVAMVMFAYFGSGAYDRLMGEAVNAKNPPGLRVSVLELIERIRMPLNRSRLRKLVSLSADSDAQVSATALRIATLYRSLGADQPVAFGGPGPADAARTQEPSMFCRIAAGTSFGDGGP